MMLLLVLFRFIIIMIYISYSKSNGMKFLYFCPQVYEVLKLLDVLLPTSTIDQDAPELSDKESFLKNQPELLQKFGMDVLPLLIQVYI